MPPAHMDSRLRENDAQSLCASSANLGEPHSSAMGNGLLELRLKSHEGIARVMYCTLALARKRLLEIKYADA